MNAAASVPSATAENARASRRTVLWAALCRTLALGATVTSLAAQQRPPTQFLPPDQVRALEGKTVKGVDCDQPRLRSKSVILARLGTQKGRPLAAQRVADDLKTLWDQFKIAASVRVAAEPDGVWVHFVIKEELRSYDQVAFRGMNHFTVEQARQLLEIDDYRKLTEISARYAARQLEDRYRRDGYAFVHVTPRTDDKTSTVTFLVDEGPLVKVRSLQFRGNNAFPASAFLGLEWNLIGNAKLKCTPGLFGDAAYSEQTLREDLDRLRSFYRGRGYKDAVVELERLDWRPGYDGVDIVIRVIEGRLYHVASVDVEQSHPKTEKPLYPRSDLLAEVLIKPGDPVTREAMDRDELRLGLFYGRRGFPSRDDHRDLDPDTSFYVDEAIEIVDPEKAQVHVVYRVHEGRRKRLREVRVSGNQHTRDEVIRREISVLPGEWIDTEELAKSQDRLLSLQYFGDPATADPGVSMRLKPVVGDDDLVDLEVVTKDGTTGQFLWGVGVSSNTGLFASVEFMKRNFDWRRPPTGLNPIGWFGQILENEAFHGGGQTFDISVSPGVDVSQASISFYEPDVFGRHVDLIGMGINGFRRLRRYESYDDDTLEGRVRFDRRFGRDLIVGVSFGASSTRIHEIAADAPEVVWDAEGRSHVNEVGATLSWQSLDRLVQTTSGYKVSLYGNLAPTWLGGDRHFWRAGVSGTAFLPVLRDSRERAHVLELRAALRGGGALGDDVFLYLPERYFMGGQASLRGFEFRGAGPTQFGRPTGGELQFLGGLEYSLPIFSTRMEGQLRETELVRAVAFTDFGMLGDSFDDDFFWQLRASSGFGVRIIIPGLGNVPMALDFGWPWMRQASDQEEVFSFTFRTN